VLLAEPKEWGVPYVSVCPPCIYSLRATFFVPMRAFIDLFENKLFPVVTISVGKAVS
jgi:hypothetical protein